MVLVFMNDSFKVKNDLSCGFIALRRKEEWEVLLIDQVNSRNLNSYWTFPKGHQEGDETFLQTAKREFEEEVGISVKSVLTDKTFDMQYSFLFDKIKINKTVKLFLGFVDYNESQRIKPQIEEVKSLGWFNFSDSFKKLSHRNTKSLLKEIEVFIKTEEFDKFVNQSV